MRSIAIPITDHDPGCIGYIVTAQRKGDEYPCHCDFQPTEPITLRGLREGVYSIHIVRKNRWDMHSLPTILYIDTEDEQFKSEQQ